MLTTKFLENINFVSYSDKLTFKFCYVIMYLDIIIMHVYVGLLYLKDRVKEVTRMRSKTVYMSE